MDLDDQAKSIKQNIPTSKANTSVFANADLVKEPADVHGSQTDKQAKKLSPEMSANRDI